MLKCPVQIEEIIIKYLRGQRLSKQELVQLREWQGRSENHQVLPDKFQDADWIRENLRRLENVPSDRMWDEIRDRIAVDVQNEPRRTPGHLRRVRQWAFYAAAVSGIILGWFVLKHQTASGKGEDIPVPVIARAGAESSQNHQVLLTLADGRILPLDHVPNGKVVELGDLMLTKTDSNQLEYSLKSGSVEMATNSRVTTGQTSPFRLVFPDGSRVLVSYGSSISTSFHNGVREMALSGEALFETVKNSHQPLTVLTKRTKVQVLGTLFDVSSYEDEPTGTISLISGAVRVTNGGKSRVLKSLESAVVTEKQLNVRHLQNPADVLGWANRDPFQKFENADLNTVIRRIAHWHRVKVYNPGRVGGAPITGVFRQKEPLEVTLGALERAESGFAFLKRKGDTIEISAVASR